MCYHMLFIFEIIFISISRETCGELPEGVRIPSVHDICSLDTDFAVRVGQQQTWLSL